MNLSELLSEHAAAFDAAKPIDRLPLPPGEYDAVLDAAGNFTSNNDKPGYKLTFKVVDGPHAGRRVFHNLWFTVKAIGYTKHYLMSLGVTSLAELDKPGWHRGIRCRIKLTVNRTDGGAEFNTVNGITLTGRDTHPADLFPPEEPTASDVSAPVATADQPRADQREDVAAEPSVPPAKPTPPKGPTAARSKKPGKKS